jgi:uncharacterized protein (TIGR03067 family)
LPDESQAPGSVSFKVDLTAAPKTMDIRLDGERTWLHAIYQLYGDKLTICWKSADEKQPPTEFTFRPGSGQTVVTLKRQEP